MENVQLLGLTLQLEMDGGSMAAMLERLHFYTWLKWGGLALYFLLIAPTFRRLPGLWRGVWLVASLPALLAVVAFFRRGLPNELLALSIGVMFLLLTLYAWRTVAQPVEVAI